MVRPPCSREDVCTAMIVDDAVRIAFMDLNNEPRAGGAGRR
jgi:hypothetical protein